MRQKRRSKMHIVDNPEDELIEKVLQELRQEEDAHEDLEERVRLHRRNKRRKRIVAAVLTVVVVTAAVLVVNLKTFTRSRISTTYEMSGESNVGYEEFAGGVLKYSKDGIALVNRGGEEEWNQPYQIRNPIVNTCHDEAVVVADKGGNSIYVLDRKGLKGEMQATLPIEKVVVSAQGIVCAVLKTSGSPKLICYDAAGNILVELTTSLTGTGYPMDVSLSDDGKLLLVSYLSVENGQLLTRIKYYNFEGNKTSSKEHEVTADEYPGEVAASVFFMDEETSVVAMDDRLLFYEGASAPKLTKDIALDKKIKSVFHSEDYVGLVLKNEGKGGYELCLYNRSGKQLLSESFSGDYTNAKISGSQILMYNGKQCSIYTRNGIHKYEGEIDSTILEILPTFGINRYIVMSTNGMNLVRFVI